MEVEGGLEELEQMLEDKLRVCRMIGEVIHNSKRVLPKN